MRKHGFTLIEILIIVAIISLLAIALIAAINPLEIINRGRDTATYTTAGSIDSAIIRFNASGKNNLSTNTLTAAAITTESTQAVLNTLVADDDLKSSFIAYASTKISPLFLTLTPNLSKLNICFAPLSKAFKARPDTAYDAAGEKIDCTKNTCHLCINSTEQSNTPNSPVGSLDTQPEAPSCDNFNSEYPSYAYTCNTSSKWQQYNCSNYCVADKGCDSFCPPGTRHLVKTYTGTGMANFVSCIAHTAQTTESYCVTGAAAHCDSKNYSSSSSDYIWGCTNPRRPYAWN